MSIIESGKHQIFRADAKHPNKGVQKLIEADENQANQTREINK